MRYLATLLLLVLFGTGCGRREQTTWVENDVENAGVTILLGYQIDKSDGKEIIVPVAKVLDGDAPTAAAMVFVTPLAAGGTTLGDELPAQYVDDEKSGEPTYRVEDLVSGEKAPAKARFRIVTPDGELIREIALAGESG